MQRKQNQQEPFEIVLEDLSYGLDVNYPPASLPNNGLQQAENVHYDFVQGSTAKMPIKVPGVVPLLDMSTIVNRLIPDLDNPGYFLLICGQDVYYTDLVTYTLKGTLAGVKTVHYSYWGNKILIASGGNLQAWDSTTLTLSTITGPTITCAITSGSKTVTPTTMLPIVADMEVSGTGIAADTTVDTTSTTTFELSAAATETNAAVSLQFTNPDIPTADIVYVRLGRVLVASSGNDYLKYSAQGDETNWVHVSGNNATAASLLIGENDGADMTGIVAMGQFLVVFKSKNGGEPYYIYSVTGEPADGSQTVEEVNRNADCINPRCCLQAGNDVYFLGRCGFNNLANVIEKANVKEGQAGYRINSDLVQNVDDTAAIWALKEKRQIVIRGQNSSFTYICNYVTGAFTVRKWNGVLNDIVTVNGVTYVAKGNKVLRLDASVSTDDGVEIQAFVTTKRWTAKRNYVLERVAAEVLSVMDGQASVQIGALALSLPLVDPSPIGYLDETIGYLNDSSPFDKDFASKEKGCNYLVKSFEADFIISSGSAALREIIINGAEV